MLVKKTFKYLALIICFVLLNLKTNAQSFSYIYIQGDKETPFYVKMEDEMQPRYGKNYCIISQLVTGIIHIQVLFQQNAYPPQKYTLRVPDNGYRGFILTRKGNTFSLYDIQQQFYIPAGNSEDDDHVSGNTQPQGYVATKKIIPDTVAVVASVTPPATHTRKKPKSTTTSNKEPKFIDNLEMNNERTLQNNPEDTTSNSDQLNNQSAPPSEEQTTKAQCTQPITRGEFEDLNKKMLKHSDNTRLKFLLGKLDKCFTTGQIRILTRGLNNDPERYEFLKQAYPNIIDKANFPSLETLLSTLDWKGYFKVIGK